MAKNVMRTRSGSKPRHYQAGFSMIEMLMTAFILAVGLLGLCMLQTFSLRATRGSASLTTAVHVVDAVMDQVELEGRISWLNKTASLNSAANLANLYYLDPNTTSRKQTYNLYGDVTDPTSTDPKASATMFTVTTTRVDDVAATLGQISDFSVLVQFVDAVDSTNTPRLRSVLVTRSILHG